MLKSNQYSASDFYLVYRIFTSYFIHMTLMVAPKYAKEESGFPPASAVQAGKSLTHIFKNVRNLHLFTLLLISCRSLKSACGPSKV